MKQFVCHIIVFVLGTAAGILLSRFCPVLRPDAETISVTDTLTVRDTIIEKQPVYVTNTRVDTMLVAVTDTVSVNDTVYVRIDREQKHYEGKDYEAWVSGYRPALDSIYVFPETKYITEEIIPTSKPKRWGIGVQVGYGMSLPDGRPVFAPYVGVGISYSLIRW